MRCATCSLEHHGAICPNGFRDGRPRTPEQHEAARAQVEEHQKQMALLGKKEE